MLYFLIVFLLIIISIFLFCVQCLAPTQIPGMYTEFGRKPDCDSFRTGTSEKTCKKKEDNEVFGPPPRFLVVLGVLVTTSRCELWQHRGLLAAGEEFTLSCVKRHEISHRS